MECLWVLGQRLDFLADGETTRGHYSLFHLFIPAGPPGPLPHTHRDADEFFFVVEGRVAHVTLGEGDGYNYRFRE